MYIYGGGWVLCDFRNKKWSSLGCFLGGGYEDLFLRFLCVSCARVVVVVVSRHGDVLWALLLGGIVVAVVGVTVFVVAACIIRCSCGDICVVGISFCSRNW